LQDRIAIGFSYRTGDAIMGMLEYQLNEKLRFGYSYDYTISNLNPYNLGTHEVMIRYEFNKDKTNIQSTRYF
jgi:hypothetical protein